MAHVSSSSSRVARGIIFSSKSSSARFPDSKNVFIEISNAVRGSHIRRRGRSFAASVPSDSSKPQKIQRRVPIHERRAMVEAFVHKYRISNAGKFPDITTVTKQVGGSFYVIRQILQEMVYEFKLSSVNKKDEVLLEMTEKAVVSHFDGKEESRVSTTSEEVSNLVTTEIFTSPKPPLVFIENSSMKTIDSRMDEARYDEASSQHFKAKEESQVSTQNEQVLIEEVSDHDTTIESPFSKSIMKGPETTSIEGQMPDARLGIQEGEDCHLRLTANESLQDNNVDSARDQVIHSTPIGKHSHQIKLESGLQPPEEVKGSGKDGMTIKGSDSLKGEPLLKNVQEGPESENFHPKTSKKSPSEEPADERSTVWGNLKSLADGIINFWKKL